MSKLDALDEEEKLLTNGHVGLDFNGPVPVGKGALYGGVKQLMTCPYDESHRVGFGHFALHLINCRKKASAYDRDRFVVCQYNACHHMDKSVYVDHLKICDDYRQYQEYTESINSNFELPPDMQTRKEFVNIQAWKCYGKPGEQKDRRPPRIVKNIDLTKFT